MTVDYATHQISGDATGGAGTQLHVPTGAPGANMPEAWFTLSVVDRYGFAADIRPLLRQVDVDAMRGWFDLSSYADVKAHAVAIYNAAGHPTPSFKMPLPA